MLSDMKQQSRRKAALVISMLAALAGVASDLRAQPAGTGRSIVMLGDSLTQQGNWTARFRPHDVRNRGVGWERVIDILRRLDHVVEERPAAVFLMIGVNDLKIGTPPETVAQGIGEIARRLQQIGIPVIFQSTLFVNPARRPDINGSVRTLNEQIQILARELRMPYLDLNQVLAPKGQLMNEMTGDGLHLTETGYAAWTANIDSCVKSIAVAQSLNSCQRP